MVRIISTIQLQPAELVQYIGSDQLAGYDYVGTVSPKDQGSVKQLYRAISDLIIIPGETIYFVCTGLDAFEEHVCIGKLLDRMQDSIKIILVRDGVSHTIPWLPALLTAYVVPTRNHDMCGGGECCSSGDCSGSGNCSGCSGSCSP